MLSWGKTQYLYYENDTIDETTIDAFVDITETGLDLVDTSWYIDLYGIGSSPYEEIQNWANFNVLNSVDSMRNRLETLNYIYFVRGFTTEDEYEFVDSLMNAFSNESFSSEDIIGYSED